MKDLFDTDWCAELEGSEKSTRKEGGSEVEVVLLAGLQRLARGANMISQKCVIQTPSPSMVQAIFTCTFMTVTQDLMKPREVSFVGTADCNTKNTTGAFAHYPTAVAESRAEARCLRKALGIRMLSSEEIGFREGAGSLESDPGGKVGQQQVAAIETLCTTRGIDVVVALTETLSEERASNIFELSEITVKEAQSMMKWLNGKPTSSKPATTKDKRDARKAELKGKEA